MNRPQKLGVPATLLRDWTALCSAVSELQLFWRFHLRFTGNKEDVHFMQDQMLPAYLVIRKSLLVALVMQIRSITDGPESRAGKEKRANLTFEHFLKELRSLCPPEFHAKLAGIVAELRTHCKPFRHWGDKRFAHADRLTVLGGNSESGLPAISQPCFQKAFRLMNDFVTSVHRHFNSRSSPAPLCGHKDPAAGLFELLHLGLDAKRAEVAVLIGR
jgi:hypothetical protein